jgi:hypothetical protein
MEAPDDLTVPRPDRKRRPGCLLGVGAALLGTLLVVGRWYLFPETPGAMAYWSVDSRDLGVFVYAGPGHSCWIERTVETATQVQILGACRGPIVSLGSTANLVGYEQQVSLAAPLGDRQVIDNLGQPAMFCPTPKCQGP